MENQNQVLIITGLIATCLSAIATIIYTFFTYRILSATRKSIEVAIELRNKSIKQTEFEIYSKLCDDLLNEKALVLFEIIESDDFVILNKKPSPYEDVPYILASDLDNYVLSPLEDLAKYKEDGIIGIKAIDTGFGVKILSIGNNEKLVNYILEARKKYKTDRIYSGVETLVGEVLVVCDEVERSNYKNYFDLLNGTQPKVDNQKT